MTAPQPTTPGSDSAMTELVARCNNFREDVEQPCTGTLRYRWGMIQAACDTCGGWCGIAVARWTGVEHSITGGSGARPVPGACTGGADCPALTHGHGCGALSAEATP